MTREQLVDLDLDRLSVNREARRGLFDVPVQRAGNLFADDSTGLQHSRSLLYRDQGFIAFTLIRMTVFLGLLLFFGQVIALSVAAGFTGGFLASWLSNGLRKYPNYYIDIRDTD